MDPEKVQEEVRKVIEGDGAETPPAEAPKEESTPVVKTEEPKVEIKAPEEVTSVAKMQEQISNLNKALAYERDEKKQDKEKITVIEKQLEESKSMMDRMKSVFVPEEEEQEAIPKESLTKEELLEILAERDQKVQLEQEEKKRMELIQNEIKELETEYSGKDGGLKYDDQEVLKWQQDNKKLYLSPKEAFSIMRSREIIDHELKKALKGKKTVDNVEIPGGNPLEHEPTSKLPKTQQETRAAILEAIEQADATGDIG